MSNLLMLPVPIIAPKKVPAKNAFKWMQDAWKQFKRFPLQWSGILLLNLLILQFMPSKLHNVISELLCAYLFIFAWIGDQKGALYTNVYGVLFKKLPVWRLLLLGFVEGFILLVIAIVIFASFEDTFLLVKQVFSGQKSVEVLSEMFTSQPINGLFLVIFTILAILFVYYALSMCILLPALIAFHHCTISSALGLFFTLSFRNWRALIVYWFTWSMIGVAFVILATILTDSNVLWGLIAFYPIYVIAPFYMWKDMFSQSNVEQNDEENSLQTSQFDLRLK